MILKAFKVCVIGFSFLVLARSEAFGAEVYKIKIKSIDSCASEEVVCKKIEGTCFSILNFQVQSERYAGPIDAAVAIKDGFVDIRFKIAGKYLSTTAQGWDSFYDRPESFSGAPQIVRLYYPNSAIKNDGRYSVPLVIRPPNKFITAVAVYLEPVSGQE